jgi:hypothetical protein
VIITKRSDQQPLQQQQPARYDLIMGLADRFPLSFFFISLFFRLFFFSSSFVCGFLLPHYLIALPDLSFPLFSFFSCQAEELKQSQPYQKRNKEKEK